MVGFELKLIKGHILDVEMQAQKKMQIDATGKSEQEDSLDFHI